MAGCLRTSKRQKGLRGCRPDVLQKKKEKEKPHPVGCGKCGLRASVKGRQTGEGEVECGAMEMKPKETSRWKTGADNQSRPL